MDKKDLEIFKSMITAMYFEEVLEIIKRKEEENKKNIAQ